MKLIQHTEAQMHLLSRSVLPVTCTVSSQPVKHTLFKIDIVRPAFQVIKQTD